MTFAFRDNMTASSIGEMFIFYKENKSEIGGNRKLKGKKEWEIKYKKESGGRNGGE